MRGRCAGGAAARPAACAAWTPDGKPGRSRPAASGGDTEVAALWARAIIRDLEDRYAVGDPAEALEKHIVDDLAALQCALPVHRLRRRGQPGHERDGDPHRVVQPVEPPAGWAAQPMLAASISVPLAARPAQDAAMMSRGAAPAAGSAPSRPKRAGRAAEGTGAGGELAAARAQAAAEAERLDALPADETVRRDVLEDLATRLDALARHLEAHGLDAAALRAIIAVLRDETVPGAERGPRAAVQLRAFADAAGRAPFWKRGALRA